MQCTLELLFSSSEEESFELDSSTFSSLRFVPADECGAKKNRIKKYSASGVTSLDRGRRIYQIYTFKIILLLLSITKCLELSTSVLPSFE